MNPSESQSSGRAKSGSAINPPRAPWSRIGLGCVTFGREIDRAAAFRMMDHALMRGITVFDTAAAYGGGASETILGEWLRERATRNRITLATKIIPPYTPAAIDAAFAASLQRLGVDTVDVLFLHRWDTTVEDPEVLRALDRLVRTGQVGRLGASNFTVAQLERALALQQELGTAPFRALQNNHNLAVREVDAAMAQVCERWGIAVMSFSPLGAGFLTGKHEQGVAPGSRFELIPGHQAIYFNELARQRLAQLRAVAARSGLPMAHLALAWALHQPQITTVLIGGRTPAHIDQAFDALERAAPELLRELDAE